ncbi:hypothetical protein F0562_005699 [Nyssa sinensis]|uniref:Uncharacterized protein n=1 Tax=Nyssa sinensis TaxID=561372 RepID=A0A5J5APK1_9ASTE|nr:hypothetical protein F0562_005699 [Nyssa sinensis]
MEELLKLALSCTCPALEGRPDMDEVLSSHLKLSKHRMKSAYYDGPIVSEIRNMGMLGSIFCGTPKIVVKNWATPVYLMLIILLLKKQDKVEEIGAKTFVAPVDVVASAQNIVDTTVSVRSSKNANSASANFVAHPPPKKRAFRMCAHEDYVELDDDVHSNEEVSILSVEGRGQLKMPVVENMALATEAATLDKSPALSDIKSPTGSELSKRTELETNNGSVAGERSIGFSFPTAPAPSVTL